jgi:HlyD family secretion protein
LKKWVFALILLLLVAGGGWYWHVKSKSTITFRTDALSRADLIPTIDATGTVEPQEVVDVGAQVAGLIISFGKDDKGNIIDYGSEVEAGQVLARIDDTLYAADAANAQATLEQAKAGVTKATADLAQMQAKLEQAKSDWDRAQKLGMGAALSESDFNTYKATYDSAVANVGVDRAIIEQAKATVTAAQAGLKRSMQNLNYCTISSPVKGIIIDRRVNIGETVVSSLNSPSLFLLAKDLRQIQVWVSVNEADIGNVHLNQPVSFTVDAYPNDVFRGTVGKIRLNASMTQNVVTYTVEVNTDNSDGRLLPYLSANVKFEVANHKNALLVANAALRWYPEASMVSPAEREAFLASKDKKGGSDASDSPTTGPTSRPTTRPSGKGRKGRTSGAGRTHGTVWVQDGEFVKPVKIRIGDTDSIMTEVLDDSLKEGDLVVDGTEDSSVTAPETSTNPFGPQVRRGPR